MHCNRSAGTLLPLETRTTVFAKRSLSGKSATAGVPHCIAPGSCNYMLVVQFVQHGVYACHTGHTIIAGLLLPTQWMHAVLTLLLLPGSRTHQLTNYRRSDVAKPYLSGIVPVVPRLQMYRRQQISIHGYHSWLHPVSSLQSWSFCHDAVVWWAVMYQMLRLLQLASAIFSVYNT